MTEYIGREALKAEFKRLKLGENSFIERVFADGVYAIIEQLPAADVAPIEALERLRDELCEQGLITMEGLKRLNALIDECAHGNEGGTEHG